MFTLHTRLALQHRDLTHPAQRNTYTGDIILCSNITTAGPIYRRLYSIFLPRPTVIPDHLEPYNYPPPGDMVERWQRVEPFKFTPDNITLASEWHGGQHTLLYALSSSGNLTPGSNRPSWCQCTADHYFALYGELKAEVNAIIKAHPAHPDIHQLKFLHARLNLYLKRIEPRLSPEFTR